MRKALFGSLALMVMALAAGSVFAVQSGTWECMGYTVIVTPDDPEDPNASGKIEITKVDDYATVNVEGTYTRDGVKKPVTTVAVSGTITTPDAVIEIAKSWTLKNGPKKAVWYTVLSWIESQIAS